MPDSNLIRKKVESVKFKYSPQKRNLNKYNQVFVKEYKFGLLSLQLKKVIIVFSDIMVYLTSQIIF